MPIVDPYTENALADYMNDVIGSTLVDILGWTIPDSYQESVNETLLDYGTTDISEITGRDNIRRLRVLARKNVWKSVVAATAGNYQFAADGGNYNRKQIHENALANLKLAETDALEFSDQYRVGIDTFNHKHDPYQFRDEDERTL